MSLQSRQFHNSDGDTTFLKWCLFITMGNLYVNLLNVICNSYRRVNISRTSMTMIEDVLYVQEPVEMFLLLHKSCYLSVIVCFCYV